MRRALLTTVLVTASAAHAERGDELAPEYRESLGAAEPRISVGLVGMVDLGVANTASLELAAAMCVRPGLYLDAQTVLTGDDFLTYGGLDDVAMYGGALGASVRHWRDFTMLGARAMTGYSRLDYIDPGGEHPMSGSDRGFYAEVTGLAAVRMMPWVALELRVEVRQWLRTEGHGRTQGGGMGIGLHATF